MDLQPLVSNHRWFGFGSMFFPFKPVEQLISMRFQAPVLTSGCDMHILGYSLKLVEAVANPRSFLNLRKKNLQLPTVRLIEQKKCPISAEKVHSSFANGDLWLLITK